MQTIFKLELEKLGFLVNEPIPNILIVENFISKEELEDLKNVINNTAEEDWYIEYTKNLKRFCLEKFEREDVENLVAEGKFEVTVGWEDKNLSINNNLSAIEIAKRISLVVRTVDPKLETSGLKTFQRMKSGVKLTSHTDQDTDPSIRYATILYINDDYEGGELFFTNKDIKIKPRAGSLLIFPGTEEFHHGVDPVEEGPIRYVLVGFIKVIDFYKNNKY